MLQVNGLPVSDVPCQVSADLAISQGCGRAGGQISRELANPQVGAVDTSAIATVVVPAAQELATCPETGSRPPVSGQVAKKQVSSMSAGQTKGELTSRFD
jgi:hypothetical protein